MKLLVERMARRLGWNHNATAKQSQSDRTAIAKQSQSSRKNNRKTNAQQSQNNRKNSYRTLIMIGAYCSSCADMKVKALPVRPARPVRPTRCT
jgi:hypothetical protein